MHPNQPVYLCMGTDIPAKSAPFTQPVPHNLSNSIILGEGGKFPRKHIVLSNIYCFQKIVVHRLSGDKRTFLPIPSKNVYYLQNYFLKGRGSHPNSLTAHNKHDLEIKVKGIF